MFGTGFLAFGRGCFVVFVSFGGGCSVVVGGVSFGGGGCGRVGRRRSFSCGDSKRVRHSGRLSRLLLDGGVSLLLFSTNQGVSSLLSFEVRERSWSKHK